MADGSNPGRNRSLAQSLDELRSLHQLCREGRLYAVEQWIAEGRPLQLMPDAVAKGTRPKTALQITLETGQHSLASLLLGKAYRLDFERYALLDMVLEARRWDLFDLLLKWGADLNTVDVYTVLNTYNVELYERFRAAGYDLTHRHEMGAILGHGTSNRPLLGFAKRHRAEDPKIQRELDIALGYQVKAGNEKGVNLCLWAGADPHTSAPDPSLGISEDADTEDGAEHFSGWSAIERAAAEGQLTILKRLGPDPSRDDFDNLYRYAKYGYVVDFLAAIQPPKDLTPILSWHLMWLANPWPWTSRTGTGTIEAILACKVRWEETDPERIADIRRLLIKVHDYDLKTMMSRLRRPDLCAPEMWQELVRTPAMQARLLPLGFVKRPVSERQRRADEVRRLLSRYDRAALYREIWAEPVREVAKKYGISGVRLGKVCRTLQIPVPPRGYWARVQNGSTVNRPPLKRFNERQRDSLSAAVNHS